MTCQAAGTRCPLWCASRSLGAQAASRAPARDGALGVRSLVETGSGLWTLPVRTECPPGADLHGPAVARSRARRLFQESVTEGAKPARAAPVRTAPVEIDGAVQAWALLPQSGERADIASHGAAQQGRTVCQPSDPGEASGPRNGGMPGFAVLNKAVNATQAGSGANTGGMPQIRCQVALLSVRPVQTSSKH